MGTNSNGIGSEKSKRVLTRHMSLRTPLLLLLLVLGSSPALADQAPTDVPDHTLKQIEKDLSDLEKQAINIVVSTNVRRKGVRPFVCGFYNTKQMRSRNVVVMFMWRAGQGLIPKTAHDNGNMCYEQISGGRLAEEAVPGP